MKQKVKKFRMDRHTAYMQNLPFSAYVLQYTFLVKFQVLTAASTKMAVFWDAASCTVISWWRGSKHSRNVGKLRSGYTSQRHRWHTSSYFAKFAYIFEILKSSLSSIFNYLRMCNIQASSSCLKKPTFFWTGYKNLKLTLCPSLCSISKNNTEILYEQSNNDKIHKPRRLRWAKYVVRMGKIINICIVIFWRNILENDHLKERKLDAIITLSSDR
jgi:hypothetical protein